MLSDSDARILTVNSIIMDLLNKGYMFPPHCPCDNNDEDYPSHDGFSFEQIWEGERNSHIYIRGAVFDAYPKRKYAYIFKNNQEPTAELVLGKDDIYYEFGSDNTMAKDITPMPLEDLLSMSDEEFTNKYE